MANMTSTRQDSEPVGAVPGYPKLAAQMGFEPATVHFKTFPHMGLESLFREQSELFDLDLRQRRVQADDFNSGNAKRMRYCRDWQWLKSSEDPNAPGNIAQLELARETDRKIWPFCNTNTLASKSLC